MATRKKFDFFPMRKFVEPWGDPTPEPPPLPTELLDTDFKKKYPPDLVLGQELDDNARVWKVYRDESIQHDDGMLQAWNNTINILLTFSGLFSAAVTAFVVESYQFLQTGVIVLNSTSNSPAVNDTAAIGSSAMSPAQPSSTALLINGLWFTSLFLALAVAFLCILVKQWLDEYTVRTRASSQNPRHWSRRRAFYFRALDDWAVAGIISVLPVLLHAALFLFFAGMVVLLSSLTKALAAWLSVLAGALLLLYVIALCIPLWNTACPYATPLVTQARRAWILTRIWILTSPTIGSLRIHLRNHLSAVFRHMSTLLRRMRPTPRSEQGLGNPSVYSRRPLSMEDSAFDKGNAEHLRDQLGRSAFDQALLLSSRSAAESNSDSPEPSLTDRLDCEAFCWLLLFVSDSDASAVAFQSLGAVVPCSPLATLLRERRIRRRSMRINWHLAGAGDLSAAESARIVTSTLALGDPTVEPHFGGEFLFGMFELHVGSSWLNLGKGFPNPQLQLLQSGLGFRVGHNDISSFGYRAFRDLSLPWTKKALQLVPSLHLIAVRLATMQGTSRNLVLLYLCFCQLSYISRAQWTAILSVLQPAPSSCLHHSEEQHSEADSEEPDSCDFRCILEGLFISVLGGDPTVDIVVIRKLLDGLLDQDDPGSTPMPFRIDLTPHDSPTWVSYIMSPAFQPRSHSRSTLWFLLNQFDSSFHWSLSGSPDIRWLKLWQRIAHLARLQASIATEAVFPSNLVASLLRGTHTTPPTPSRVVLRAVLRDGRRPSIWNLLSLHWHSYASTYPRFAGDLAVALCSIRRSDCVDDLSKLVDWFLAPIDMRNMMWSMGYRVDQSSRYNWARGDRYTDIHLISHILELRASWWVQAVNRLQYDDEEKRRIRAFALAATKAVLQRGPCSNCHSVAPPDSFGVWVHLDNAGSEFLSRHKDRDAALSGLEETEDGAREASQWRHGFGTLEDWKSDDEDEDAEDMDGV